MPCSNAATGHMKSNVFADDYLEQPYWWMAAHPDGVTATHHLTNRRKADVIIVGSGITGIVAALDLAEAGTQVIVIDAQEIGGGAARRSAGMVGRSCRKSIKELTAKFGASQAKRMYLELNDSMKSVHDRVARENIQCHLEVRGRFVAANSSAHLEKMIKSYDSVRDAVGFDYKVVRKEDTEMEVASKQYHGGVVIPDLGAIHPGLYHEGLVKKAIEAGVQFAPMTQVHRIRSEAAHKIVETSNGEFTGESVLVATNGYTTRGLKWMARRLIPFRAFMIATEELPPELIDRVIPHRRTYVDSFTNSEYFRPAPDTSRILFGGMTGTMSDTATPLAERLRDRLVEVLPDLRGVRLSRAWLGRCAVTFDFLPHFGQRDGIHYALGYNFSGINLATHFGAKVANRILGRQDEKSGFESLRFPTVPLYDGRPWFIPAVMRYYQYRDNSLARS